MKDEDAQRKGVVILLSKFGRSSSVLPVDLIIWIYHMRNGVAKRIAGFHFCFDNPALRRFIASIQLVMPRIEATRVRTHIGDQQKVWFELQTYGIPTNQIPILHDGTVSLDQHREWLGFRRNYEEQVQLTGREEDGVIVPRRFDVLFGRGRFTREHTGNLRAAHIVEMYRVEYEAAGKFQKTIIAERIVRKYLVPNGRDGRF